MKSEKAFFCNSYFVIRNYFVSLLELKKEVEKGVERLFCIKNRKIMSEMIKNRETFVGF